MTLFAIGVISVVTSCSGPSILEQSAEARHLATSLQLHFAKGVDAGNRAVMVDADEGARAFASEAGLLREQIKREASELSRVLRGLEYAPEVKLVERFRSEFAAYEVLDRNILELAVEHTNLKATRLALGPASEAADAFINAVREAARSSIKADEAHVRAATLEASIAVREIQVVLASHIVEPNDAPMTGMEKGMAESEADARRALHTLAGQFAPEIGPRFDAVAALLDRFVAIKEQIVVLSRRNTNIRSLTLTLGQKRTLAATCEESLRAIGGALAERASHPTR